ncbi:alkaline phosphatase family protein [Evansella sp. LMS18]|uniref:alkaline phosphatase family protein n=1 Tax=Evansella sp. LMS18 TaxID=2924033 RepID=UPI0020D150E8|nr:alkaline phosphatase family protein [Evansella sp. LMS18]UTR09962.1 alkaline phosphatase family protein [Evansella sp. LMS18]
MKKLLFILLICIVAACQNGEQDAEQKGLSASSENSDYNGKKVVMIIVDTMMGSLFDSALQEESMPALQFLIENGQYYKDLVSPFPTMSVTIESTLLTGEMADKHKIPGLYWYDQSEDRLVNYGSSFQTWLALGLKTSMHDAFYKLNNQHLSKDVTTIFEDLNEKGFSSGAINTVIYRGKDEHELKIPGFINEALGFPDAIETKGPDVLAFGKLAVPDVLEETDFSDGVFSRYGLNDKFSAEVMEALIKEGKQPDFTLIFLPDFDKKAHRHSPHYLKGFEETDQYLQGILNAYGSWEDALEDNIFIVLGDHGSDKLTEDEEELTIDLKSMYSEFTSAQLGDPVHKGNIAFGINQRMAYIYDPYDTDILPYLGQQAMQDKRVAFAAWMDKEEAGNWVTVISPDRDTMLRFKPEGEWLDKYGQSWSIDGDTGILTLEADEKTAQISYQEYPDVLNQLYSSFLSHKAKKVVLAAKPGYSFWGDTLPTYPDGGEHGGIHKNDTLAALVIAGTDKEPEKIRILDLKNYVMELFTEEAGLDGQSER